MFYKNDRTYTGRAGEETCRIGPMQVDLLKPKLQATANVACLITEHTSPTPSLDQSSAATSASHCDVIGPVITSCF